MVQAVGMVSWDPRMLAGSWTNPQPGLQGLWRMHPTLRLLGLWWLSWGLWCPLNPHSLCCLCEIPDGVFVAFAVSSCSHIVNYIMFPFLV